MIELTDADRDAINAERVRVFVDLPAWERRYVNWDETLYRAGLAAGMERCVEQLIDAGYISVGYADDARAAIRALLNPPA